MTHLTIWQVNKRIGDLVEFVHLLREYSEHSSTAQRRRHLGSFPIDELGQEARTQLNLMKSRIARYLRDAGSYPSINYREPPAIGGRTIQIDVLENIYNLSIFQIPKSALIDSLQRAIGYYNDDRIPALLRTVNPLWWLWRLLAAAIAIPFFLLDWAGYDRQRIENSPTGKLIKLLVAIAAIVAGVTAFLDSIVQLSVNLGFTGWFTDLVSKLRP